MNFKNQIKENWKRINSNIQNVIKNYNFVYNDSINELRDNSIWPKILLKLISIKYHNNLKNWNMNYIKYIERIYSKVLRGIQYQKEKLLGNILDESPIQLFQDI